MTYTADQRVCAIAWKTRTAALPAEAKQPAPYIDTDGRSSAPSYDFCLPPALAEHTLLPEVRDEALSLFAELGIPWHASVQGGPSNHLLSSQVQCVNALMPMVDDPDRIGLVFHGVGEVLEIEPGRHLTFEYIGPTDFFGEARGSHRVRGAHCTSVDAAFLHRAPDGQTELVLVEWKYTESYRMRRPDPARDEVRRARYAAAASDPDGPVDNDLLAFDLLLDEPFYQLVRQQLLAHALERAGAANRVRVVHVLPPENVAYQLPGPLRGRHGPVKTVHASAGVRFPVQPTLASAAGEAQDRVVVPDGPRSDSGACAPVYQLGGGGSDRGNRGLLPRARVSDSSFSMPSPGRHPARPDLVLPLVVPGQEERTWKLCTSGAPGWTSPNAMPRSACAHPASGRAATSNQ